MSQPSPRFWEIFFEVFDALPRQGPGNRECAAKALAMCQDLPASARVLDLGCGAGGQTLQLADFLPAASITAVDTHAPGIERLRVKLAKLGLANRVTAVTSDMAEPESLSSGFDLVWSEGALYSVGLKRALAVCHGLLRPGGYLAFTDAVWRKKEPPAQVKASFALDYPEMGWLDDDLSAIRESGFALVGHFTLPDEAWWDDFYTPMEARVSALRTHYVDDAEATSILDQIAEEPSMHRRFADYYAYEFFVARRLHSGG